MIDGNFPIATEFTLRQLERLSELLSAAMTRYPNPHDHNLARKLIEYRASGYQQQLRRTG
jgi:hypothetical protein